MKPIRRASARGALILLILVLALIFPFSVFSQSEDAFGAKLDEHMPTLLTRYGVPGAVVSHIQHGEVAWTKAFGTANMQTGAPMRTNVDSLSSLFLIPAGLLGFGWWLAVLWFGLQVRSGRRARAVRPSLPGVWLALAWLVPLLFIWYWLYAPLPLYLPAAFPDLWPSRAVGYLMGVLAAWVIFSVVSAVYPKQSVLSRTAPTFVDRKSIHSADAEGRVLG